MTRNEVWLWSPAFVLALGVIMTVGVDTQRPMPLRAPLDSALPVELLGLASRDITLSEQEARVAGVSSYLLREYLPAADAADADPAAAFSLYVGYYDSQTQGKTIHSPKNCLPGAGWEALESREVRVPSAIGEISANRYILQREDEQALVLYWYQGRGRTEANEYLVKAQLLRDAALHGRTEEALVRIVVPIVTDQEAAFRIAAAAAARITPSLDAALPL